MSELLKRYDNAAGRTCEVRYDTARYPRPFWVDARGSMKAGLSRQSAASAAAGATYPTRQEAEHAAAHFMATGDLPKPETAQKAREGVDGVPGAVSTHTAPETHFATPLQRQSGALAQTHHTSTRGKAAESPKL